MSDLQPRKICVLGLGGLSPDIVLHDERLVNLRRLMESGVYGRLESRGPRSLGLSSFCNRRAGHAYDELSFANSASVKAPAIWDYFAREGRKSIVVGLPPDFFPRRVNAISIGCSSTTDSGKDEFVYPAYCEDKITKLVGKNPVEVKDFRTGRKDWLRDQIFDISRQQWQVVHSLLEEQEWDYFHFVDVGLDRIHHGFWDCFDPQHVDYKAGSPYASVIPEYCLRLDEHIGRVMEALDDNTALIILSAHGMQPLAGGFALNQWLMKQGFLVLNDEPSAVTPFDKLDVNWGKTSAWSAGGCYASVFLNVQGREPQGVIPPGEYESFRDQLKQRLQDIPDDRGRPMNLQVFRPDQFYCCVRNVSPDLIVCFGGLSGRLVETVGHADDYLQENDRAPDACNYSPSAMFILSIPNCTFNGEYRGANWSDLAPTVMDLAGFAVPESMQGHSLFAELAGTLPIVDERRAESDQIIHDRLAGLGYI